jgi:hypothetical protein
MKGQIFTLDAFAALLMITVMLGYFSWAFEQAYQRAPSMEQQKLRSLADDIAQISVKNLAANRSGSYLFPNAINTSKQAGLRITIDDMLISAASPYKYEISGAGLSINIGLCISASNIANARRLVARNGLETVTVKVCA